MDSRQSPSIATFFRRPSSSHHHQNHTPNDFEFHESDLYNFNDHLSSSPSTYSSNNASKIQKLKSRRSAKVGDESRSVPVSIPVSWSTRVQAESEGSDDDESEEYNNSRGGGGGGGESRVAPHEYLARKRGASLSVHEGVGRTLKGRDMSRVRNAVWKRIGFED